MFFSVLLGPFFESRPREEDGRMLMHTCCFMCMGMRRVEMERGEEQEGREEKCEYASTPHG